MKKVLVAGSTGYLGQHVLKELKKQGFWIRALARNSKKLDNLKEYIDEIFIGEITKAETLSGICEDIDIVFSSIGITRQKDKLTYMDVDYQGNKNLLDIAQRSNVSKFIYVSVLNAHLMKNLKIIQAKEQFVDQLSESQLDYTIIRPTGFFSDMLDFLRMAEGGKVYLFGRGGNKINPIHGSDLAEVCVNSINKPEKEINIGGPDVFTYKDIAELAFSVLNKKVKITYIPIFIKSIILTIMRTFTTSKTYGPLEFIITAITTNGVGPPYGKEKLKDFYEKNING